MVNARILALRAKKVTCPDFLPAWLCHGKCIAASRKIKRRRTTGRLKANMGFAEILSQHKACLCCSLHGCKCYSFFPSLEKFSFESSMDFCSPFPGHCKELRLLRHRAVFWFRLVTAHGTADASQSFLPQSSAYSQLQLT